MQTLRCLLAIGIGTALTLNWMSRAFAQTPEASSLQNHQADRQFSVALTKGFVPPIAATVNSSSSLHCKTACKNPLVFNLAQSLPINPSVPTNPSIPAPGVPDTSITEPVPSPVAPSAADLIRLSPNPDLLELPTTPRAVEIDINQPITLQQALELARRNNRDLQVAELQLRQSRAVLRQARAAEFPTASVQAGITRTDSAGTKIAIRQQQEQIPTPGGSNFGNSSSVSNTFNSSLQLNYDIFTSGQRSASIRAAEAAVRSAESNLETQAEQIRLDVTNAYYDIQQADELVRIAQAAVENSQISLRDTVALERAGLGTRFDVLQAQVQLANNQQQLSSALSQQRTSRRQLAQQLSLPETATLSSADPIVINGRWNLSLEESIIQALQNRSELAQVLEQRNIARQNRRVALASLGPQLSLGASFDIVDQLTDNQLGDYGYSVGSQVSKIIYDGGAARASAAQQEANIAIAQTQFANFKNLIRFQVEQNYFTLQSSFENIQTNSTAVVQARESLRLARLRFQAGVGTQLEVSNAQTDLTRAQSNLLQAVLDYNRSLAALQRFVSNLASRPLSPTP